MIAVHRCDRRPEEMLQLAWTITNVPGRLARTRLISGLLTNPAPTVLSFINAHAFNLSWRSERVRSLFLRSDVLLRDGSGMKLLAQMLRLPAGENMVGTTFIPEILTQAKGRALALWGTSEPYISIAADVVRAEGHRVVSVLDGFQDIEVYREALLRNRPTLVILGMGMPKQEEVSIFLKDVPEGKCLFVNGGAILDYYGGRFPRAPEIWLRFGIEWIYRLMLEPRRLASRYLIGNFLFLVRSLSVRRAWRRSQRESRASH